MGKPQNEKKRAPRIRVIDGFQGQLSEEFKTSLQTVRISLKFYSDSDLAQSIRKRAMEMNEEAMKENKKLIKQHS